MLGRGFTVARLGKAVLAFVVIVALTGCASSNQLTTPISNFATASDTAASAFDAVDAQSAASLTNINQAAALKLGILTNDPKQCVTNAKGCQLYYATAADGTPLYVYYKTLMPKSVAFMNGIRDYANALNALEKADASADVQAAFSDAMGAISAVAAGIDPPAGAAVNAVSKPLGSVVGWAYGQYQDDLKLDALKKAIPAANKVIERAVPILDIELRRAAKEQAGILQADFDEKDKAFTDQPTAASLTAEVNAANALDTVLSGNPASAIDSLAAAHAKLASAALNPKADLADTIAAVSAFVQQANNLKQIVNTVNLPKK